MSSLRRKPARPIERVSLRIKFRADRGTVEKIRQASPTAKLRDGVCEVRIEGGLPGEVAEKAKYLLEKVRSV